MGEPLRVIWCEEHERWELARAYFLEGEDPQVRLARQDSLRVLARKAKSRRGRG